MLVYNMTSYVALNHSVTGENKTCMSQHEHISMFYIKDFT